MDASLTLTKTDARNPNGSPAGFALISTLIILSLTMILVVGLLAVTTQDTQSSRSASDVHQARANARFALDLAIERLQTLAGPDQRITAEADILDQSGFAGWDRHPDKAHYLAVFSTEDWHKRDSDSRRTSHKPYDPDRNADAFREFLVSGDDTDVADLEYARTEIDPNTDTITLLGEGTVGTGATPDKLVRVPVQTLEEESTGNQIGRYAWWVGDQGIKAKANLGVNRALDPTLAAWEQRLETQSPSHLGLAALPGVHLDADGNDASELGKVISHQQLELVDTGAGATSPSVFETHYHDFTTESLGVLSDSALGGLRRDLSIPFELRDLQPDENAANFAHDLNLADSTSSRDADFTSMWEFHNSGDHDSSWKSVYWDDDGSKYVPDWWSKKKGYVFSFPRGTGASDQNEMNQYLRGPTWQMLREHYRHYKRGYENLPPSDKSRRGIAAPSDLRTWLAQPYTPYSHRHNSLGNHALGTTYVGEATGADHFTSPSPWDPFYRFGNAGSYRPWNNLGHESLGLAPVLTKLSLVFSHFSDSYRSSDQTYRLKVVADCVGTLWNPYNVPIQIEGFFTHFEIDGLRWTMERDRDGTKRHLAFDLANGFGADRQFPYQFLRLGVTDETDPAYPFSTTRPRNLFTLMPGEVRTFAFNQNSPFGFRYDRRETAPGAFVNNYNGGLYLTSSSVWRVKSGDEVTFTLDPQPAGKLALETYLGYFQTIGGAHKNPFRADRSGNQFKDLPELSSVHVDDISSDLNKFETVFTEFPQGWQNKRAFAYLEFRRRASDDIPEGIATALEPRSIVDHSSASNRTGFPSNWKATLKPVADFDLLQNGIGPRNNGFWGTGHTGAGETNITMFEIPDSPLVSLGALQHVQTGAAPYDMPYAIGGSFRPPLLGRTDLTKDTTEANGFQGCYYDMSYLANSALWDRYYFSGHTISSSQEDDPIPALEANVAAFLDPTKDTPLANRRLVLSESSRDQLPADLVPEMTHYRFLARHLMLDGAFNINSTSVPAWRAWLSSLRTEPVEVVDVTTGNVAPEATGSGGSPFTRSTIAGGVANEEWRGFVKLTDSEIETLAEAIVVEVKKRGPFLSIADFVNRRLANDETGDAGALQAAIENAGLNAGFAIEDGIPGTLRQSDILANLGNTISARSDTFIIRAYGEFTSPSGRIRSRAWCEAVVQRVPELVGDDGNLIDSPDPGYPGTDPAGRDPFIPNPDAPKSAPNFGRKFIVKSFRWLAPDEI